MNVKDKVRFRLYVFGYCEVIKYFVRIKYKQVFWVVSV
ncbi:hypothetical protein PSEUDO9AG_10568 [Pseudomonas sp. 9Ag]|nr:hypothetical protein PSEUDO9AG_10568 [Pseudomonas sp. 9Ag]